MNNQSSLLPLYTDQQNVVQQKIQDDPHNYPDVLELLTMFPEKDADQILKYYKLNDYNVSDTINFMLDQQSKKKKDKSKRI